jgi:ribosome-associated protein
MLIFALYSIIFKLKMNTENIIKELNFKAIRSSGAGGQHVNKTSSKIELTFDLENSDALNFNEKEILKAKLSSKLTKENVLILFCEETRSQHRNKDLAIKRFLDLLKTNLIRPKKRRKTKPSKGVMKRRVDTKKRTSVKKALRKKPKFD